MCLELVSILYAKSTGFCNWMYPIQINPDFFRTGSLLSIRRQIEAAYQIQTPDDVHY
jgi:hypothetical protein